MRAARAVFGRDGYSRASIDAIATEARVSTRTIYNHFEGKEQLFSSVLQASATQVADGFIDRVAHDLTSAGDLERDLVAIGRALVGQRVDFPEHFAMVRQINAEAAHFPAGVFDAWQEAGPSRVQREVVRHIEQFAAQDQLRILDAPRAALHLIALATFEIGTRSHIKAKPLTEEQTTDIITAGIRTFLDGYAPRPPRPG